MRSGTSIRAFATAVVALALSTVAALVLIIILLYAANLNHSAFAPILVSFMFVTVAFSPALFTYPMQGTTYAAALFATDYAYVAAAGAIPGNDDPASRAHARGRGRFLGGQSRSSADWSWGAWGKQGDGSCPELAQHIHCHNCHGPKLW